ncbi:uncharacterized protein BDW70DRAFT_106464 [Aspergillus foveolatus]|uniref:uncharacterized protein n=1 Tax=Aspergillus foveolatus TaxID=210207 RepID=UPI003CCCD3D6
MNLTLGFTTATAPTSAGYHISSTRERRLAGIPAIPCNYFPRRRGWRNTETRGRLSGGSMLRKLFVFGGLWPTTSYASSRWWSFFFLCGCFHWDIKAIYRTLLFL